jgi:hypothetical protein
MVSSTDFLVDHAYHNVWCAPGQDRQHIIGPQRITKRAGAIGNIKIGMRSWNLPTPSEWYHVFMIGDLPPELVGMQTIVNKWVSARAHCVSTSLLIDVYIKNGLHFPLHRTYFLYTGKGALVVAIKHTPKIAHLGEVQPWIRWRSNAYFDGKLGPMNGGIDVQGMSPTTEAQFYQFQVLWRDAQSKPGYAWAFVNGRRVRDLNLTTLKLGDAIEYYYDSSVKEVLEIKTKTLKSFDSTRDNLAKYLIPRPGLGTTIDFKDDIDIYLLNYELAAKYTGVYYNQNFDKSIRNVTHRDFSIPSAFLRGYVDDSPDGWYWNQDLRIEVIVRKSGWDRKLVDENGRIKELFKLPETKRLNAMIGQTANVSVWKAAALENSPYVKLFGESMTGITRQMVEDAYGYNAISRLIGDTPIKYVDGTGWVTLPFSLTYRSTIFEYNSAGVLLGWYPHDYSIEYPVRNAQTKYVEAFIGKGGVGLCTKYDTVSQTLETGVDYRFYVSNIYNGVSQNDWKDVTGDAEYYTVVGNVVTWNVNPVRFHTAVKSSKDFLASTIELNYRDDLLAFTVNVEEVRGGRVPVTSVMDIPPGQLDVFLNGFSLIEDIDYYVKWPEVCIVNKVFLKPGTLQTVVVRGRGFCDKDMQLEKAKDVGFVKYNELSRNARFNVRDDKVCRIVVGGQLFTRSEVGFVEDKATLTVEVANGTPYQISNPVIPMAGVTNGDTYVLKAKSEAIDKEVEDYLTLGLPEPAKPQPNPIPNKYPVFSPFTAKLIYDMLNGILLMDEFKGEYSLNDVKAKLVGYEWILPYDPALKDVNTDYVMIQPHPETEVIKLDIYQFRFVTRAIEAYLGDKVAINRHTVIVEEGYQHEMEDHPHPHQTWAEVGE